MRPRTKCSPGLLANSLQTGGIMEAAGIEPAQDSPRLKDHARLSRSGLG